MALDQPLTLTLDIDFFLLYTQRTLNRTFNTDDPLHAIYQVLESKLPWLQLGKSPALPSQSQPFNSPAPSKYEVWSVESNPSICLEPCEQDAFPSIYEQPAKIRLRSRMFSYFSDPWREELGCVLLILRDVFEHRQVDSDNSPITATKLSPMEHIYPYDTTKNTEKKPDICPFHLVVNTTCSLTVHISKGPYRARLSLRALKNLIQLITAFERVLDEMHPISRCSGQGVLSNQPSALFAPLADAQRVQPHPSAWCDFVEHKIVNDEGIKELLAGQDKSNYEEGGDSTPYVLNRWVEAGSDKAWYGDDGLDGAITFRQARGSLDPGEVVAWCEILVSLVGFCESEASKKTEGVRRLIATGVEWEAFTVLDLMKGIGVQPEIIEWWQWKLTPKARWQEWRAQLDRVDKVSILRGFVEIVEQTRWEDSDIEKVMSTIFDRLKMGIYGNFRTSVLEGFWRRYVCRVKESSHS